MILYKRATTDCGFEFVNDVESIYLSFVIKCFLVGVEFLAHGAWGCGLQVTSKITVQLSQTAEPKDYIYSVACKV